MRTVNNATIHVPRSRSALVFSRSLLAAAMAISFFQAARGAGPWGPFFAVLVLYGLVELWLSRFALALDGDVLEYRTLLGGAIRVKLAEIAKVEIESGERKYRDKFRPPFRLHIETQATCPTKPFDINLKVFDPSGLQQLFRILEASGLVPGPPRGSGSRKLENPV